jgi:hypothetical protein
MLYFSLLIVFRALDKDDIFIIMEIEKKLGIRTGFIGKFFKRFVNSSGKA